MACARQGRRFIGMDIVKEFLALSKTRIDKELMQPNLPFTEVKYESCNL